MKLYLVRHGQTLWNQQGIIQGHLDSPLTEQGRAQAMALAHDIEKLNVERVISSDLGRCRLTAELACANLNIPIEQSALLRERHFGEFQGLTAIEHPQLYDAYQARFDSDQMAISGSESASQVTQRIHQLLTQLKQTDCQSVLLFSHGEWLRTLFNLINNLPAWSGQLPLPNNCCLIELDIQQLLKAA